MLSPECLVPNYHLWQDKRGPGRAPGERVGHKGGGEEAKGGRRGGKEEKGSKAEESVTGEQSRKEKEERKGEKHKGQVESEVRKIKGKSG